jgi:hypothetical protein
VRARPRLTVPDWISRPPAALLLIATAVLLVVDHAYFHLAGDGVNAAVLDETAHLLTGFIVLGALFRGAPTRFSVPMLAASVLIDLDHIPGALGADFLTAGTPRPYTHSLTTLVLLPRGSGGG